MRVGRWGRWLSAQQKQTETRELWWGGDEGWKSISFSDAFEGDDRRDLSPSPTFPASSRTGPELHVLIHQASSQQNPGLYWSQSLTALSLLHKVISQTAHNGF